MVARRVHSEGGWGVEEEVDDVEDVDEGDDGDDKTYEASS